MIYLPSDSEKENRGILLLYTVSFLVPVDQNPTVITNCRQTQASHSLTSLPFDEFHLRPFTASDYLIHCLGRSLDSSVGIVTHCKPHIPYSAGTKNVVFSTRTDLFQSPFIALLMRIGRQENTQGFLSSIHPFSILHGAESFLRS